MSRTRRLLARASVPLAATILVAGSIPSLSSPAHADTVERAAGPERIATSVAASRDHRASATDALLATAATFPDALSAAPLATALDAPLLLTRQASLPGEVAAELERLGVERVWILGGRAAVSNAVADELERAGYEVRRIAGRDRFATAKGIALEAGPSPTGEAVVALGHHPDPDRAWPDAVAGSALGASQDRLPMLLTAHDHLPEPTVAALEKLGVDTVVLVGGPAAVEPVVESRLIELGYEVRRIHGASRYDTSVALAREALGRDDGDEPRPVVFATGGDFPDALAAGALAGALSSPLVLVPPGDLAGEVDDFLRRNTPRWDGGVIVGGTAAASEFVAEQIAAALTGAPPPEPPPEPEVVVGTFDGTASWYGARFHGRTTASGEIYDKHALTAAHRTLPFDTRIRVTNAGNGLQVVVRINDRGPFTGGRVLDLSQAAAEEIDMISSGTAWVHAEILAD